MNKSSTFVTPDTCLHSTPLNTMEVKQELNLVGGGETECSLAAGPSREKGNYVEAKVFYKHQ